MRVLPFVLLVACTGSSEPIADARLSIAVGALTATPVVDADYRLQVRTAAGAVVWDRDHLRASDFGAGANLSYVGPCDPASNDNVVALWVNALYDTPTTPLPASAWVNPTASGPIEQRVTCAPNSDVPVSFDLTIMRAGGQGFFDVAVQFADVFCSAKLDSLDALMLRPDGTRAPTVNIGFACTAGQGAETWLHYSDVALVCGDRTTWLDPHAGPGQVGAQGPGVFQLATYRNREALVGYDKCYWNLSLGLTLGPDTEDCKVVGYATTSEASFGAARRSPPGTYPYIRFEVPVTGADGTFVAPRAHALDAPGSAVRTAYTPPEGFDFAWEWSCDAATTITESRVLCADQPSGPAAAFVETPGGIVMSRGALKSEPMKLPSGLRLEGCCGNPCPGCQ